MNKRLIIKDFGKIDYARAWNIQKAHHQFIIHQKLAQRNITNASLPKSTPNYLLICEHNPVITLGKNGKMNNILLNEEQRLQKNISYYHIERGGDATVHGPGQLTIYPILDLENFFTDLHRYLRTLEECVIRVVGQFGIEATRIPGLTGVWVGGENEENTRPRKISAMGIKCSRWVTLHGLALNVNIDLSYFDAIIPCNIPDKGVTSMFQELSTLEHPPIAIQDVKNAFIIHFKQAFEIE